jgi:hypothetical protein
VKRDMKDWNIAKELADWREWKLAIHVPKHLYGRCLHTNLIEAKSPCSKQGKLDPPIWQTGLSGFVDSNGSQGRRRHSMREPLLRPSDI